MAEELSPILPERVEALAHAVLEAACARDLALATAESCTGGLLASLLTDVPGASHAFERGFVTYTNEAKAEMLGVPESVLESDGPVSEPAARAMAEGALSRSRADVAVSITGWAESGPDPEQPGGRVHFAAVRRGGEVSHRKVELGDIGRAAVRLACLEIALDLLREQIEGNR